MTTRASSPLWLALQFATVIELQLNFANDYELWLAPPGTTAKAIERGASATSPVPRRVPTS